jgi:phenylpropionate dioxygenase-like ring-hydroxylating dioxygenase large terminal subunit
MQTTQAASTATVTENGMPPLFDAETNAEIAKQLLCLIDDDRCDTATGQVLVDPTMYSDPAVLAREQERIFDRVPVIAGHSSEAPNPYDFLTVDLPGNRVVVSRQPDGSLRAFVNMCRHRGACLETERTGRARVFSCPYHGWSYNPDGGLRSVSHQDTFGDLERGDYGLIPLPVEERHGFIWVIQRPGAKIDVASWLGGMDEVLAGYRIEEFECFRTTSFDEAMNWKLAEDAFVDGYHLKFVHPMSAGPYFYNNIQVFQDFGNHGRAITPRKIFDKIRETPDAAVDPYVTVGNFLMPNSTLLRHSDHYELLTFVPHPTDPNRCRMDVRLIVPPVLADEERKLWEKNYDILVKTVIQEDLPLNRDLQRVLQGRGLPPLVLGRNEMGNQVFHRVYDELMADPE